MYHLFGFLKKCLYVNGNIDVMMSIDEYIETLIAEKVEAEVEKRMSQQATLSVNSKPVYTDKEMMELLHIDRKTLKKYRDEGLLSYTHPYDKYYYSQEDLQHFLANKSIRYEAFNIK